MQEFILFWMLFAGSGGVQVGSQPKLDEAGCKQSASHMQEHFRASGTWGARLETWCEMAKEAGKE